MIKRYTEMPKETSIFHGQMVVFSNLPEISNLLKKRSACIYYAFLGVKPYSFITLPATMGYN